MGCLNGKVAVITGAGNGIGRSHAHLFAKECAKVVVNELGCNRDGTGQSNTAELVVKEIKAIASPPRGRVCVCERLLDGCEPIIEQAARHCLHVHARVGYAEGPQVPDPRAAEWAGDLGAHEQWWSTVWDAQEFGPPPYLHTLPHTNVPVADLGDVCDWMARRQAERFGSRRR